MKIAIQCAYTKNPTAPNGGLRSSDGRLLKFVNRPDLAPPSNDYQYARPDDLADGLQTWRDRILEYNKQTENSFGLLPAYRLYRNKAYVNLVEKFGKDSVFIFSAGWGLIPADFLTPDYDITFSNAKNVKPYSRRRKADRYADLCMLPDDGDDVLFLGGKDYLPLFFKLTESLKATKKIFTKSTDSVNALPGYIFQRFMTGQNTNWHYPCAQALIDGKIQV